MNIQMRRRRVPAPTSASGAATTAVTRVPSIGSLRANHPPTLENSGPSVGIA